MVDATIHGIDRGTILSDRNYHVEAHTVATASEPNPTLERAETPVYNLVIDHPAGTILWDTGSHPEAGDGHWPPWLYEAFEHVDAADHRLDDDLAAAGWTVDDIDYVIQSHLHMDHAGGLAAFEGTDVPVFVHRDELEFAYYSVATGEGSAGYVREDFDRDLNWQVVHRDRERHFEGVEFIRLRGHSRGLMALKVDLDGYGTLLFTSDVVEVAENYERGRPPGPGILWDREHWFESLHRLQELERRHDAELVYGHEVDQMDAILDGWP
ncbi:MAG: N-acyl homoserine lactonase family protein [Haloarculaceae archaeon]